MYTEHFGLARNPFEAHSTLSPLFLSREIQEALAHFQYARHHHESFFLLVGEVGTGKSTAIRVILDALDPGTPVAVLRHTSLDARELLEEVLRRFGLDPVQVGSKSELLAQLEEFLKSHSDGAPAVLILDEAHLLSLAALEEVRLFSNLKQGERPLLQILLVGQPELLDTLRQHRLRPLRQRIAVRYVFRSLGPEETREYIRHRLMAAGASAAQRIFSHDATDAIHDLSQGLPREINVVADQAMLNAYIDGSPLVKASHVRTTKDDYGFEGVELERAAGDRSRRLPSREVSLPAPPAATESNRLSPTPEVSLPSPPARIDPDDTQEVPKLSAPPALKPADQDLPLQSEHRFTLLTSPPGSHSRARALTLAGIAAVLLGGFALAYVLSLPADAIDFQLPEPPRTASVAPSTGTAVLLEPPLPDLPVVSTTSDAPAEEAQVEVPAPEPPAPETPEPTVPIEVRAASAGSVPLIPSSRPSPAAIAADRLELGAYLARSGRLDDAIAAFREAVALQPSYAAALFNLGVSLLQKGEATEAVDVLRRATSMSPDDGLAQRSLGIALRESGELAASSAALRRAVELSPGDELALRHLAGVLRESGDLNGSIETTRKGIALEPGDASLQQELGFALRAAGSLPEAVTAFQRAVDLDGNLAVAHYSLGVTLLESGNRDEGEREIAEARRLGYDPQSSRQ